MAPSLPMKLFHQPSAAATMAMSPGPQWTRIGSSASSTTMLTFLCNMTVAIRIDPRRARADAGLAQ